MSTPRELIAEADALLAEAKAYEAILERVCHTTHPWTLVWDDNRSTVTIPEIVLDTWMAELAEMARELHVQAKAIESRVGIVR